MRFVIRAVLALLCCCYAFEQTASATQPEGHIPPQHFVEQHVPIVKQQIPLSQQQIIDNKIKADVANTKVNDQQSPQVKFIESHIIKVLQHFAEQRKQRKLQVGSNSSLDAPNFVAHKIETLKKDLRKIIKLAETHIPYVINQQIALKNQLKEKQQLENKDTDNAKQEPQSNDTKTAVNNIPKISNIGTEVGDEVEIVLQHIDKNEMFNKTTVLLPAKDVRKHEFPNIADIENREIHDKSVVAPKQIHSNIRQPIDQDVACNNKCRKVGETIIPGTIEYNEQQCEGNHDNNDLFVPDTVEEIIQQVHKHVPEVNIPTISKVQDQISQNLTELAHDIISSHEQGIGKQPNQQKSNNDTVQVQNNNVQKASATPEEKQQILEQTANHVLQAQTQQITQLNKTPIQVQPQVQGIVEKIHQHIPQVVYKANQDEPEAPDHILDIVEKTQKHSPQVIKEHIIKVNDNERVPAIPAEIHQVPQVIKPLNTKTNPDSPLISEHIKTIIKQIHQHVPQIVNELKKQVNENRKQPEISEHVVQPIRQQHPSPVVGQTIAKDVELNENMHSIVPSNIEGVVQQIHLQIPQVINHDEDHIAQEQNHYTLSKQNIAHINSPEYVIIPTSTLTSNIQPFVPNVPTHPVVEAVDKLTLYEIVKNSNIVPSHVQQVQKENHISPVRTI